MSQRIFQRIFQITLEAKTDKELDAASEAMIHALRGVHQILKDHIDEWGPSAAMKMIDSLANARFEKHSKGDYRRLVIGFPTEQRARIIQAVN